MALPELSDQQALNKDAMLQLQNRDSEGKTLFEKLYSIYLDETPALLKDLRDNLKSQDYDAAHEIVHQLKGSAAAMGATKIHSLTKLLLERKPGEQVADLEELPERVEAEFAIYRQEVDSALK